MSFDNTRVVNFSFVQVAETTLTAGFYGCFQGNRGDFAEVLEPLEERLKPFSADS